MLLDVAVFVDDDDGVTVSVGVNDVFCFVVR